ncbi:MAG: GxxExxY protein [Thermodesulfobacteriota bacterium]|nr:GxxExxY protein [Thermodesulfobacteriota bacterium]
MISNAQEDNVVDHRSHEAQILDYLKATRIGIGRLINFRHPKAETRRFVLNLPEGHDACRLAKSADVSLRMSAWVCGRTYAVQD